MNTMAEIMVALGEDGDLRARITTHKHPDDMRDDAVVVVSVVSVKCVGAHCVRGSHRDHERSKACFLPAAPTFFAQPHDFACAPRVDVRI